MADAIAFASNTIITNKEAKNEHAEKKTSDKPTLHHLQGLANGGFLHPHFS